MGEQRRKAAIMGGSFNPPHIGHLMVADYARQALGLECVYMVLSPQNPFKAGSSALIDDRHRMAMLEIACRGVAGLEACDVELTMPRPSYTINTLREMSRRHPDTDFRLIVGGDNWQVFDRWRAAGEIIRDFGLIVYPRPGYEVKGELPDHVTVVDAPTVDISSTFIRERIAEGFDMNIFLPRGVFDYIKQNRLYI